MTDVRLQLSQDHAELEALLQCLSEDSAAPECGALQTTWGQFETRLLAHMDAEERYLLPLLEMSNPAETAHTRMEHARIRQLVSELGVAIELHAARQPAIEALIAMLRTHSAYEERVLYQLAGERASAHVQETIVGALKAAARFALEAATNASPSQVSHSAGDGRAQP